MSDRRKNMGNIAEADFYNPKYYDNRELSWLKFNQRILNEARDTKLPLMERLSFLSITSSNLDEFFMVRVASLKDMVHAGYKKPDLAGMTPEVQLLKINEVTKKFVTDQYICLNRSLLPLLEKENIRIYDDYSKLNDEQKKFADRYFEKNIFPTLTPMAVDASRPFPLIRNKTLNIALLIKPKKGADILPGQKKKKSEPEFATVQVPSVLDRVIQLPSDDDEHIFILLEALISAHLSEIFMNYDVITSSSYRIMRNADFSIDEDDAIDLLEEIQKQLKKRQWGECIRLEVSSDIDARLLSFLKENLCIRDYDIFSINGPVDLTFLSKIPHIENRDDLYDKPFSPRKNQRITPGGDIFSDIRKGDILLKHPYESFDPVVDFIRQGAQDPNVLAIKMTLYRVSGNSPIIANLAKAAENRKQVTVLVELKARFDEEHNIVWAKKLEKAGCHVIYGVVGLKTHCKTALIVRREEDGIRRYVHLGTGNYNDSTAKHYTDCGMFTCKETYGEDASSLFNMLSGYSEPRHWNKLIVAPIWMRKRFLYLIQRETENAREGRPAMIVAKMNSLCDREIIANLYEASAAGVVIHLIVRGICCLRTGIPGISDNITVTSIVGRFLEHGRIFYFKNAGTEEFYMGSADWMPRNLDKRVEVVFPVEDQILKEKLRHYLLVELSDNLKSYYMDDEGEYVRPDRRGKKTVGSQAVFMEEAEEDELGETGSKDTRIFVPVFADDNNEYDE
jgi:polyphosphate kinase